MSAISSETSRPLDRLWCRLAEPRPWAVFLLGYLALHLTLRLLLSDTLQLDDAEQLIQSQTLRLDYGNFQPPFYTWLLWAVFHFTGPQLWVLYVIRYAVIGLSFWLWHRVSRLLFDKPRWIVASATAWLLLGELGWKLHQGSTHTTLLTLALVMSLHAIVLLLREARLGHYLYLGLAVGLGMMAKYSYAGFVVLMLGAALTLPETRARLLRWPMLASLVLALLLMLPALLALFWPETLVSERLQGETRYRLAGLLGGDPGLLREGLRGALGFLAPLWLIYLGIWRWGRAEAGTVVARLLDRFHLAVLLAFLIAALFVSLDHLKVRWLHPFLLLVPFWWLVHARRAPPRRVAWPLLQWVTVALLVLVIVARLWQALATPHIGHKPSRVTWPVNAALRQVPPAVLMAPDLSVGDTFLGAHLRLHTGRQVRVGPPPPGGRWLRGGHLPPEPLPGERGRVVARNGKAEYGMAWGSRKTTKATKNAKRFMERTRRM